MVVPESFGRPRGLAGFQDRRPGSSSDRRVCRRSMRSIAAGDSAALLAANQAIANECAHRCMTSTGRSALEHAGRRVLLVLARRRRRRVRLALGQVDGARPVRSAAVLVTFNVFERARGCGRCGAAMLGLEEFAPSCRHRRSSLLRCPIGDQCARRRSSIADVMARGGGSAGDDRRTFAARIEQLPLVVVGWQIDGDRGTDRPCLAEQLLAAAT